MSDAEYTAAFERRAAGGSFYVRERSTGRRTRCYINLGACRRAVERGELYTDAEYAALTTMRVGAAPRRPSR